MQIVRWWKMGWCWWSFFFHKHKHSVLKKSRNHFCSADKRETSNSFRFLWRGLLACKFTCWGSCAAIIKMMMMKRKMRMISWKQVRHIMAHLLFLREWQCFALFNSVWVPRSPQRRWRRRESLLLATGLVNHLVFLVFVSSFKSLLEKSIFFHFVRL